MRDQIQFLYPEGSELNMQVVKYNDRFVSKRLVLYNLNFM